MESETECVVSVESVHCGMRIGRVAGGNGGNLEYLAKRLAFGRFADEKSNQNYTHSYNS